MKAFTQIILSFILLVVVCVAGPELAIMAFGAFLILWGLHK